MASLEKKVVWSCFLNNKKKLNGQCVFEAFCHRSFNVAYIMVGLLSGSATAHTWSAKDLMGETFSYEFIFKIYKQQRDGTHMKFNAI